jgi:hypothetical protein
MCQWAQLLQTVHSVRSAIASHTCHIKHNVYKPLAKHGGWIHFTAVPACPASQGQ